jgi:hypothetical protein
MIYSIMDAADLGSLDFSKITQTSVKSIRYNKRKSKFIVSFSGEPPAALSGSHTFYSKSGITQAIKNGF